VGHTQWLAGVQLAGIGTAGATDQEAPPANAPLPELALGARRGLSDTAEIQINGTLLAIPQARTGSLELAGKLRLYAHGRWSFAVGAAGGYRLASAGGAVIEGVTASAPLIAGIELGRHQLVVSGVGGMERWYASGARPGDVPFVGGSLGFVWQLGAHLALLPEVSSAWSPTRTVMSEDARLFHAGIAVLWTR
jgi:hypothetical protein